MFLTKKCALVLTICFLAIHDESFCIPFHRGQYAGSDSSNGASDEQISSAADPGSAVTSTVATRKVQDGDLGHGAPGTLENHDTGLHPSKELRNARDGEIDTSDGSSTLESRNGQQEDLDQNSALTASVTESGENSSLENTPENNDSEGGTSRVTMRATPPDEPSSGNSGSQLNSSVIDVHDIKRALRDHQNTASCVGDADYFGMDNMTDQGGLKRDKKCSAGNINVCNRCNVYIYNKIYEMTTEPCAMGIYNEQYANEPSDNDQAKLNSYGPRTILNETQNYPAEEMIYAPEYASAEVRPISEHQKKKMKSSFRRPESQYTKSTQYDTEEDVGTASNTERNFISKGTPVFDTKNVDDSENSGLGTSRYDSTLGSSIPLYNDVDKFQPRALRKTREVHDAEKDKESETDSLMASRNAVYDNVVKLLETVDDSNPSTDSVRKTRSIPVVKSNKVPKSRNAKYDIKFLGLMEEQNQKTDAATRHIRSAPDVEMDNEWNTGGHKVYENLDSMNDHVRHSRRLHSIEISNALDTSGNNLPEARNADYDIEFLHLMKDQRTPTHNARKVRSVSDTDTGNNIGTLSDNNAPESYHMLQSNDRADRLVSLHGSMEHVVPSDAPFRQLRNVPDVEISNEWDASEHKFPTTDSAIITRNAMYDDVVTMLGSVNHQDITVNPDRKIRNVNDGEGDTSLGTSEHKEPEVYSDLETSNAVQFTKQDDDPAIQARIVSAAGNTNELGTDGHKDYDNVVKFSRSKRDVDYRIDPVRDSRTMSDAEIYNRMGIPKYETDSIKGTQNTRFDNVVKFLGSMKHQQILREARNVRDSKSDKGFVNSEYKSPNSISARDAELGYQQSGIDSIERKDADQNVESNEETNASAYGEQNNGDIEIESAPEDALDNANDAITIDGPRSDAVLETGSTPAKQGQVSLIAERSSNTNNEQDSAASPNEKEQLEEEQSHLRRAIRSADLAPERTDVNNFSKVKKWSIKAKSGTHNPSYGRKFQDMDESFQHKPMADTYFSHERESNFQPAARRNFLFNSRSKSHKNKISD